MRKKGMNNKKKTLVGYLIAVIALANMPFCPVSATNTPLLSIQEVTVQVEDISESRNIGVDLVISNNQDGFLASSFGIRYNENLTYTAVEALTNAGENFEGCGDCGDTTASTSQDESIIKLYFDISEDVDGGDFGLEFVWTGMDDSNAYWYVDKKDNIIDELIENSNDGVISFRNPGSETLNYTDLRLNPNAKEQLQIANASGNVYWFSKNTEVAEVDQNGIVTAVSAGNCDIQVLVNERLLTCNVTVLDLFHYSITDTEELIMTSIGTPVVLEYPDATETVTWISANPTVVKVDDDGTLHALQEGTANILATCKGKTYMKSVTVNFSMSSESKLKAGDANGDGNVDISDVVFINKVVLGKEIFTAEQIALCDFNENGIVDATDALTLMKIVVNII